MSRTISVDKLSDEISNILSEYSDDVAEETDKTIREVANEAKDQLKVEGDFENRTGQYRKGWKVTFEETRLGLTAIVHNKKYQLTHLLESGHAKWLFGRYTGETVRAFPHIEKVNDEAQRKLEEELERRLGDL